MRAFLFVVIACMLGVGDLSAAQKGPVAPADRDKCPVCGMFVKKYPDWTAQIIFKDGSYAVFDGTKDMFKYYHEITRYSPGRRQSDIDSVYVTDYYSLRFVDGLKADYVMGSDVFGPMGRELVPFSSGADAREFMADHKGKGVLKFGDVTTGRLKELD